MTWNQIVTMVKKENKPLHGFSVPYGEYSSFLQNATEWASGNKGWDIKVLNPLVFKVYSKSQNIIVSGLN